MERPLNGFSADPGGRLYAARVDFALVGASLRSRIESANWRICSESPGPVARSPREALGMHARSGRTVVPDLATVFIAWSAARSKPEPVCYVDRRPCLLCSRAGVVSTRRPGQGEQKSSS